MDAMGFDGLEERELAKKVEIAQITFAFDNAELIKQLTLRGNDIKAEAWGKLEKRNDKILKMVQKQEQLDKLQRPCSVFVTMMNEEGYERATFYLEAIG